MNTVGGVYKRGDVWYILFTHRNRRHRESSGSADRKVAVALLKKRISEVVEGRIIGPQADRVTFEDLAKLIEAHYITNARKSTVDMLGRVSHLTCSPTRIQTESASCRVECEARFS